MSAVWRVMRKELSELALGARGWLLVWALPILVVLLVGQLQQRTPVLRTLVVGAAREDDATEWRERALLVRLLVEAATFDVATRDGRVSDPLAELRAGGFDLLIAAHDDAAGDWRIFTAETDPKRLVAIERAMAGLERALPAVLAQAAERADAGTATGSGAEESVGIVLDPSGRELVRQLVALAMLSSGHRFLYYPAAANPAHATLPMTIGLVVCFLPFVLVAPGLVRDRELRTLDVLLAAPGVGPAAHFLGRCLSGVLVTLPALGAMVVAAWLAYGLYPQPGTLGVVLTVVPALAGSAFLGVATASLSRSQAQATGAAAAWLLWLLLVSGVLIPLDRGSATLGILARLSPLTAVHELFNAWMFGAPWAPAAGAVILPLLLQAALFGLAGWLAYMRLLRQL